MWNEALILLIAQMSCLPIRLRPSLHRSEHRCRLIGANAHDYLMVYDIYVIEPIGFHSSPTLTFCPFSASTAQRPEETQEKGTRSLASAETDYLNVTPWIEIGDWVVSEGSRLFALVPSDCSCGRGRPRGQGHHQVRDLPASDAAHRPDDAHTASLLAQRRTRVRKELDCLSFSDADSYSALQKR